MTRIDYGGDGAGEYRRSRTLPPEVLDAWRRAVTALDLPRGRRVLDVGAGTGQFVGPLARWLGGPVVGVEPDAGMRAQARAAGAGAGPSVAGVAERLPVAGATVGVAWLSTVVHQFADRAAAAAELRRVVQPGGCVLVRGFFADQVFTGLLAGFPGIERSAATFPTTDAVAAELEAAGFRRRAAVDVVEPWAWPLAGWAERVRSLRAVDSALRPLTDHEIEAGIAAATTRWGGHDGPVPSPVTLRLLVCDG